MCAFSFSFQQGIVETDVFVLNQDAVDSSEQESHFHSMVSVRSLVPARYCQEIRDPCVHEEKNRISCTWLLPVFDMLHWEDIRVQKLCAKAVVLAGWFRFWVKIVLETVLIEQSVDDLSYTYLKVVLLSLSLPRRRGQAIAL